MAIAIGCGLVWTLILAYALFGPPRVYGSPTSVGVLLQWLLWVGFPLIAILFALRLYACRDLGRRNAWVTGGGLVGVTLLLGIPALEVLPRYDGDGLWAQFPFFAVIATVGVVGFSIGAASEARRIASEWPLGAVPPRPDKDDIGG